MRHAGRDEQKIAFLRDYRFLESFAKKIVHLAFQNIDACFEPIMVMRFGLAAGREDDDLLAVLQLPETVALHVAVVDEDFLAVAVEEE